MDYPIVYEHANFQGRHQNLASGAYKLAQLSIGNDVISSLQVPAGWRVTLFEDDNFQGMTKVFTQDASYVGDDFNDKTSSIVVYAPSDTPFWVEPSPSAWWFYAGISFDDVNHKLQANNARLISLDTYMDGPLRRFAVVMVPTDGTEWYWFSGINEQQLSQILGSHQNCHLSTLRSYMEGSTRKYAVVLTNRPNTSYWYYLGMSADGIHQQLVNNNARLVSQTEYQNFPDALHRKFACVMLDRENSVGWWAFEKQPNEIMDLCNATAARPVSLDTQQFLPPFTPVIQFGACLAQDPTAVWWFYYGKTADEVVQLATDNCAYPSNVVAYPDGPLSHKFACILLQRKATAPQAVSLSCNPQQFRGGDTVPVTVRICPVTQTDALVKLQSSNSRRLSSGQVTVPAGALAVTAQLTAGTECGSVDIIGTTGANDSVQNQTSVEIIMAPTVTAIAPEPNPALSCQPFKLWVTGLCMGGQKVEDVINNFVIELQSSDLKPVAGANSAATLSQVDSLRGPTRLCANFIDPLGPGSYKVRLVRIHPVRMEGPFFGQTLEIKPGAVAFSSDPTWSCVPAPYLPCQTTQITLHFTTSNALSIKIYRGNNLIHTLNYPTKLCRRSDSFTDPTPVNDELITYKIVGSDEHGDTSPKVVSCNYDSTTPRGGAFTLTNNRQETFYLYWVNNDSTQATPLGQIGSGETKTANLANCTTAQLVASLHSNVQDVLNDSGSWAYQSVLYLGKDGVQVQDTIHY